MNLKKTSTYVKCWLQDVGQERNYGLVALFKKAAGIDLIQLAPINVPQPKISMSTKLRVYYGLLCAKGPNVEVGR